MPWVRFEAKSNRTHTLYKRLRDAGNRTTTLNGYVYAFFGKPHLQMLSSYKAKGLRDLAERWQILKGRPDEDQQEMVKLIQRRRAERPEFTAPSVTFITTTQEPAQPEPYVQPPSASIRTRGLPPRFWYNGPGSRMLEALDKGLLNYDEIRHAVYVQYDVKPTRKLLTVQLSKMRRTKGQRRCRGRVPPKFWQQGAGEELLWGLHNAAMTDEEAITEVARLTGVTLRVNTIQCALREYRARKGLIVTREILAARVRQGMYRVLTKGEKET